MWWVKYMKFLFYIKNYINQFYIKILIKIILINIIFNNFCITFFKNYETRSIFLYVEYVHKLRENNHYRFSYLFLFSKVPNKRKL